ncbi:Uncharacterised protein [Bordetella pertussis]|nr:Uncharacterised protein [Bordetella pertussis]
MRSVSACSSARATTLFTMPMASASRALMRSPRNRNSLALRAPMTQGWIMTSTAAVASVWQTGSEKNASSEATMRSHMLATMNPPAMHAPLTCAIVGLGQS